MAGELPPWLQLDDWAVDLCVEWIKTRSWSDSKAILTANADQLLTSDAAVALDELELANPERVGDRHIRDLLADCLAAGSTPRTGRCCCGNLLNLAIDRHPVEAKQFLLDHQRRTGDAGGARASRPSGIIRSPTRSSGSPTKASRPGDALLDDPDQGPAALAPTPAGTAAR